MPGVPDGARAVALVRGDLARPAPTSSQPVGPLRPNPLYVDGVRTWPSARWAQEYARAADYLPARGLRRRPRRASLLSTCRSAGDAAGASPAAAGSPATTRCPRCPRPARASSRCTTATPRRWPGCPSTRPRLHRPRRVPRPPRPRRGLRRHPQRRPPRRWSRPPPRPGWPCSARSRSRTPSPTPPRWWRRARRGSCSARRSTSAGTRRTGRCATLVAQLGTVTAVRVVYGCWLPPDWTPDGAARTTTGASTRRAPAAAPRSTSRRTGSTSSGRCSARTSST